MVPYLHQVSAVKYISGEKALFNAIHLDYICYKLKKYCRKKHFQMVLFSEQHQHVPKHQNNTILIAKFALFGTIKVQI